MYVYYSTTNVLPCRFSHSECLFLQRGRRVEGCWVFGGVERLEPDSDNPFQEESFSGDKCRMGNAFAVIVEKRDARTLIPILRRFVRPGSIIMSDMWMAYDRIEEVHDGGFYWYTHESVNHSLCFKDPTTGCHTNTCEGAWQSQYKRHIPKQSYNKNALQGHLFQRMWFRKYRSDLWENLCRVLAEIRFEDTTAAHATKSLRSVE